MRAGYAYLFCQAGAEPLIVRYAAALLIVFDDIVKTVVGVTIAQRIGAEPLRVYENNIDREKAKAIDAIERLPLFARLPNAFRA